MIFKNILFVGTFVMVIGANVKAESAIIPELSVWVDEVSEPVIRNALDNYEYLQDSYGEYFPELYPVLTLTIEKKSHLTPAQFRKELETELLAGGGPDLIYIDEYNQISGQYLMEQGHLLDLKNVTDYGMREGTWEYFPGLLEAGQMDGTQYVLPVYVQCPVVFGLEEELTEAGLTGEYKDLSAFLAALLEATEQSGKQIFENTAVLDWIESYCLPQKQGPEREALETLLEAVRTKSGQDSGFFSPYESLDQGESLLSGCALESLQKIAQNLGLFEKEQGISFLLVPAWDGETRMSVTHAAAVNANTRYPKEARRLVSIFQESYTTIGGSVRDYFPATSERDTWQEALSASVISTDKSSPKTGREIGRSDKLSRSFQKCVRMGITDGILAATKEMHLSGLEDAGEAAEKKILTVAFTDRGRKEQDPLYRWLQESATLYESQNEDVYIQLAPKTREVYVDDMYESADLILYSTKIFQPGHPDAVANMEKYADLTAFLGDTAKQLSVFATENGEIKGILYAVGEQERAFLLPEHSQSKEEAAAFCLTALEHEMYEEAVRAIGEQPVER